jgi:2-hydroxycyclohexanecarboxyl-CoA dehydrogenase
MSDFSGRNAIVIGSGGMGSEVCRQIAHKGGRVYYTYNRSSAAAEQLAASLPLGSVAGYRQLDVTDEAAVADTITDAVQALGGVDILAITAGYVHEMTLFEDIDSAAVRQTIDVELIGVITLARYVLPQLRSGGYGRIVTVGSESGKVGAKGESASAAARGGVIAFSKALARETADTDICVNVVCPGPTETTLLHNLIAAEGLTGSLTNALLRAVPKRRAGKASEIAALTVFLASEEAGYITGQAISVSGGLTMC